MNTPPPVSASKPTPPQLPPHSAVEIVAFFLTVGAAGIVMLVMLLDRLLPAIERRTASNLRDELELGMGIIFLLAFIGNLAAICMAGLCLARTKRRLFPILTLTIGLIVFATCLIGFWI